LTAPVTCPSGRDEPDFATISGVAKEGEADQPVSNTIRNALIGGLKPTAASAGSRQTASRRVLRLRSGVRLQHLLFLTFTTLAAVPIVALALWDQNVAYQHELDSVREQHLLVARNLTTGLSRYVQDVEAAFALAFESGGMRTQVPGLEQFLVSLNVVHLCILGPDDRVEHVFGGVVPSEPLRFPEALLGELRKLAASAGGKPALTQLSHDNTRRPVFYLAQLLPEGRLGVGVLNPDYIIQLQKQIAFGEHGHAVIVDATGRVIAHPFAAWIAGSQDMSAVPVVQAMMRGETGVGQFYSPAMQTMMVAGYSVVPENGWGVMVPQPLVELQRHAAQVNRLAMVVALVAFAAAALLSWLLAAYFTRPVRQVAATAEAVLAGNETLSVPEFRGVVPREIRRLRVAFNTMLDDLRRRNADTTAALRQAETSSIAKSQFLANMSHEIRTPLHGVVGMIELLQQTELSPMQMHYVRGARKSGELLLTLIDDVLDLSKIEAGKVELEHAPFHLPSLAQDALLMFGDQARSKGLALTVSVPAELNLTVCGDAHRLSRILTNLVGNALKFTAEGSVAIRLSNSESDADQVWLRCEVADTGIGIPQGRQRAIFEAFSQADTSTTRRYGGTGLGLSIALQLCHLMGGEIGVDSTVGVGSTFWFRVRLQTAPGAALPATPAVEAPRRERTVPASGRNFVSSAQRGFEAALARLGRGSIRILLVEDNTISMRVTQALLESIGCKVAAARSGVEAVAAYRDGVFDVVLLDCQMPEMDGYETARAIRQIEAFRGCATPIIALTANALVGSRDASLAAGMDDQLTKPLTLAELSARLLHWLAPVNSRSGAAAD
jgi:signal transduction histidine kinase/ActR/RegA family two-component response regulator